MTGAWEWPLRGRATLCRGATKENAGKRASPCCVMSEGCTPSSPVAPQGRAPLPGLSPPGSWDGSVGPFLHRRRRTRPKHKKIPCLACLGQACSRPSTVRCLSRSLTKRAWSLATRLSCRPRRWRGWVRRHDGVACRVVVGGPHGPAQGLLRSMTLLGLAPASRPAAQMHVEYPMLFNVESATTGRSTHCGVLEFVAEEGVVYMPHWVRPTRGCLWGALSPAHRQACVRRAYARLGACTSAFRQVHAVPCTRQRHAPPLHALSLPLAPLRSPHTCAHALSHRPYAHSPPITPCADDAKPAAPGRGYGQVPQRVAA
jgi:hypothetical protein